MTVNPTNARETQAGVDVELLLARHDLLTVVDAIRHRVSVDALVLRHQDGRPSDADVLDEVEGHLAAVTVILTQATNPS